jgi:hypothetical protein
MSFTKKKKFYNLDYWTRRTKRRGLTERSGAGSRRTTGCSGTNERRKK